MDNGGLELIVVELDLMFNELLLHEIEEAGEVFWSGFIDVHWF